MTEGELGWAAGTVDGEGCISLRVQKTVRSQHPQYMVYISVGNTDPRMPKKMCDLFGGWLRTLHATENRRPIFEWRIYSTAATDVIRKLRPYLVIKGEQADIALAFAATVKRTGGHTTEIRRARAEMLTKMTVLKREGVA